MASYTAKQLYGAGTYSEDLSGTKTFQLTNPSTGSSYFFIETVRNNDGFYDSNSYKSTEGTYSLGSGINTLVTSSYIAGVVVEPGVHSMTVEFDNIPLVASESILRATGGTSLVIS